MRKTRIFYYSVHYDYYPVIAELKSS